MSRWGDLLGDVDLGQELGALDWPTGIIRINSTYEEFHRIANLHPNKKNRKERELMETVSHEVIHFMQICTSGYLYSFVTELYEMISKCLPSEGFKDWNEVINLNNHRSPEVSKILTFVEKLDKEGPEGITIRSIIESSAFFIQKRMHMPKLNGVGYLKELVSEISEEYRSAYDYVVKCLGKNHAFISFPLLSFLSLCVDSPIQAFVYLCEESKRLGIYLSNDMNPQPFVDLLKKSSFVLIGSSIEEAQRRTRNQPVYIDTIKRLNTLASQDRFNVFQFALEPHLISQQIAETFTRPMLFKNKDGKYYLTLPQSLWAELKGDQRTETGEALLGWYAASARILGSFESSRVSTKLSSADTSNKVTNSTDNDPSHEGEYERIMKEQCANAVNYSILVNAQSQAQIAIEDDNILPVVDSLYTETCYSITDSSIGFHSFIHLTVTVENTKKSSKFTIVICPLALKNIDDYRYGIESLIRLTYDSVSQEFGKKDAEIGIVDRVAANILVDQNLDFTERMERIGSSRGAYYLVKSKLPLVASTFLKVQQTPLSYIHSFKSAHCHLCKLF